MGLYDWLGRVYEGQLTVASDGLKWSARGGVETQNRLSEAETAGEEDFKKADTCGGRREEEGWSDLVDTSLYVYACTFDCPRERAAILLSGNAFPMPPLFLPSSSALSLVNQDALEVVEFAIFWTAQ